MEVRIPESAYNNCYLPHLFNNTPTQIYYGGSSSGKSVFIAQKIITNIMSHVGYNVLVLREVSATNHDSTFQELEKVIESWGLRELFHVNKSKGGERITCTNGNVIIFKGLDDIEKVKSTTFKTGPLIVIWVEEASETSEKSFNQLRLRLRGRSKLKKYIILSFNPIDSDHWIKKRFFDTVQDNTFILKTTYKDNVFLEPEDIDIIESYETQDNYYYQVYALGNWGVLSIARVFNNVKIWDFTYTEEDLQNVNNGMDFGFVHASTLMRSGYREDELFIFDEHYYKGLTNAEFVDKIDESGFDKRLYIVADSAEPDRIKEFSQRRYNVSPSKKGKGSLKDGIDYLRNFKINIHKTNCPNAAREFVKFKRKELKDGTIIEHEFFEHDDDTIAGVRYGNEHLWKGRQLVPVPRLNQTTGKRRSRVSNLPN